MLSGRKIVEERKKGNIVIEPFTQDMVNPNSYDVTLHDKLLVYRYGELDPKKENGTAVYLTTFGRWQIVPGVLYLGRTNEYTETHGFIPGIEGKSSLARLGISIHETAGFGDEGFKGYWTLEISCIQPVIIYPNMKIAQLYYDTIEGEYDSYNGKYQNNKGVGASKSFQDFK